MVVLGLVLLVVAVVAAVVLVVDNTSNTVQVHAFGGTWSASAFWMAVVGAAILVVAVLGLALLKSGSARNLRRRRERRTLARENARLAEQVQHTAPVAAPHDAPATAREERVVEDRRDDVGGARPGGTEGSTAAGRDLPPRDPARDGRDVPGPGAVRR